MTDYRHRTDGENNSAWLNRRVGEILNGTGVNMHFQQAWLPDPDDPGELVEFVASDKEPGTVTLTKSGFNVHCGKEPARLLAVKIVKLAAIAVHKAQELEVTNLAIAVPDFWDPRLVGMGVQTALLRADEFQTTDEYRGVTEITFVLPELRQSILLVGLNLGRASNVSRWLTMMPTNRLGVHDFAQLLEDRFKDREGVTWIGEPTEGEYARMGLLNAVAAANGGNRRVVAIRIDPLSGPTEEVVAYVGKTMVYDMGGISDKGALARGMKADKGGGCTLEGDAEYLAQNREKLSRSVIFVWAITENCTGPNAYRPDDVEAAYSGKSVEIDNTDAEGRLALADAMAWICDRFTVTQVVLVCTLTGAAMIALGKTATALHLKDSPKRLDEVKRLTAIGFNWADAVNILHDLGAGKALESPIADIKNAGGGERGAGSQQGFAFIAFHAPEGVDVMELDIAGKVDTKFGGGGGMQAGTPQPAGTWFIIGCELAL